MAIEAALVSTPEQLLPAWTGPAVKVYYETDDFVAGGPLLGLAPDHLQASREQNVARSHIVLGVTSEIVSAVRAGSKGYVLPNGCNAELLAPTPHLRPSDRVSLARPVVGVVGQLNERLDIALLDAVVESGVSLLLVGPRCERSNITREALDRLIGMSTVQWIDRVPQEELPRILAALSVGLTPYTRSAFNDGSFPLKTLEYLAAGLPVVSSDLPSARRLGCPDVVVSGNAQEFGRAVANSAAMVSSQGDVERRQAFARRHGWPSRAEALIDLVTDVASKRHALGGWGVTAPEDIPASPSPRT
jgi:teichuronic acid biosynthesis glycosyltransferase TuaH